MIVGAGVLVLIACAKEPTAPTAGLVFTQVSAGTESCALTTIGAAYCWRNSLDSLSTQGTPEPVPGGPTFQSLSAGADRACGVRPGGAAYCWGKNRDGRLGTGAADTIPQPIPVPVAGGLFFTAVSVGGNLSCGVTTSGAAYCWGRNFSGGLGDGTTTTRATPVRVAGGLTFSSVSAGGYHSCGVTTSGAAYCWGHNGVGQLGIGDLDTIPHPIPVAVAGELTFRSVSAGGGQTCGLTPGGATYCWGENLIDLLGNRNRRTYSSRIPAAAMVGIEFVAVSVGGEHACGITRAGAVYCWGGYVS